MIRAAVVLMLALCSCSGCAHGRVADPEPSVVTFRGDVLAFMASIQREFSVETVLCLTGRQARDTLYVDDVRLAGVTRASASRAHFTGCKMPGVVGFAHNHPTSPCIFSLTDLFSMQVQQARVILVTCRNGFAWRTPEGGAGMITWTALIRGQSRPSSGPPDG